MKRVHIENLAPGMIVARNVFNANGQILVGIGTEITPQYIQYLKNLGILSIYVSDDPATEVNRGFAQKQDVVSERVRVDTMRFVKDSFLEVTQFRRIDTAKVQSTVSKLLDEILANENVLVNLTDIRTFDDYTFGHSVNVCVLSLVTGLTLGMEPEQLKEIGIGALLHDIGKIDVSQEILSKPDDLTVSEYAAVQKHSEYGYELLQKHDDLPLLIAQIALQHHERWDGNGYPRRLGGRDIHEYARIVAVADVYDALMADRPYRANYSLNQTITIIRRLAGVHLDPTFVDALCSNVAVYPVGSLVELNTGSIAIVVSVNKSMPTRPVVKILYDKSRKKLDKPHQVDLAPYPTVMIKRNLSEEECRSVMASC